MNEDLAQLLINAGRLALKGGHSTEWLAVDEVLQICKDNTPGQKMKTMDKLEQELETAFGDNDEFYDSGVNVIGRRRRMGWQSPFMLRFYRYDPNMQRPDLLTPFESSSCND